MNKKILLIDLLSLCLGFSMFLLLKIFYLSFGNGILSSLIFGIASIAMVIIIMYLTYKNDLSSVSIINFFVAIFCFILIFIIYSIPFWGFIGIKGANNGLIIIFMFMYGAKYLIYLSKLLENKSRNVLIYNNEKTLKSTKKYYRIISIYAWILLFASIFLVSINIFFPISEIGESILGFFD